MAGHPELPLTKWLIFGGTFRGHAFDVGTAVSDVLTFGGSPDRFSFRGKAHLGRLHLDAEGVASDAHALRDFDADARLASAEGDAPWPLPDALAHARPFTAQGHVNKAGTTWTGTHLHATLGRRTGGLRRRHLRRRARDDESPRRVLRSTLREVVLDIDDLRAPAASDDKARTPGTEFTISATPLPITALQRFDADVDLIGARFVGGDGLAQSLRLHAALAAGLLRISGLDVGIADGHVTGTLQFDAARSPAELALALNARSLRLERLAPTLAKHDSFSGRLDAHAALRSWGDSPRALASAVTGTVTALLQPGASISKRLDAKLSLDGGEWLNSLFDKSERVPVQCAELALAVDRGTGTSQRFTVETEHTALVGRGSVSLASESIDATLTPTRKTGAAFALDKAIHARGPWRDIKVSLEPPAAANVPARCGG